MESDLSSMADDLSHGSDSIKKEVKKSPEQIPSASEPQKVVKEKLTMFDALQEDDEYGHYDLGSPNLSSSGTKSTKSTESKISIGEEMSEGKATQPSAAASSDFHSKSAKQDGGRSKTHSAGKEPFSSEKRFDKNDLGDGESPPLDPDDFILKPRVNGKLLNVDSMNLQHSFGYDCVNGCNLCVADERTLLYHTGHIIHILNPYTREMSFRWSSGKYGISFIAKNPVGSEIAIAEKGNYPDIVCYTWPDFGIISVLRGGAKNGFVCLDFSACGELMVSQSTKPDYLLTIWKWKEQQVYLSVKANNQDVYKTSFSPLDNTILICSGLNHLKFWKIETTFTGMKIKGSYGKFGPADICDISTFIINDDNMLFSNCPWGNMFFWDGSRVKFEISRKELQPAHDGIITFFYCDPKENNVYTAGQDGQIRVWDYGKMFEAWPAENKPFEMQPSFEREITDIEGRTACPVQLLPKIGDDNHFFLQDKNGGIWNIDLALHVDADPWVKIMETHSGPIVGLDVCPTGYYFATIGTDGKLLIHNTEKKRVILIKQFQLSGSFILWLPLELDPTSSVLIIGFVDGTIRVVVASVRNKEFNPEDKTFNYVNVLQALKPHSKSVTYLEAKINYGHHHVLSGGDDGTVFIYTVLPYYNYCQLCPLGYIQMPGPVTHIEFKKVKISFVFLVSTTVGTVSEVRIPEHILNSTNETDSYLIDIKYKTCTFKSVKSCVLRNLAVKSLEERKNEKLKRKEEELERLKLANPNLSIDEDFYYVDSEEYDDIPSFYKPPETTRINFARYAGKNIWISPDGYDGGFYYEYKIGEDAPCRIIDIPGTDREVAIQCCISIYRRKYLLMGMSNGCIRLVKTHSDPANLSDYFEMNMHESFGHRITKIGVSYDHVIAYSCGTDGGVFSYVFHLPVHKLMDKRRLPPTGAVPDFGILGIISPEEPTLEEIKAVEREKKKQLMSETIKMEMKAKVNELAEKYAELIERNKKLPEDRRLPKEAFVISKRIDQAVIDEYNKEIDEFKKTHEYEAVKVKVLRDKMYKNCVKPIKTFPIYQFGIRIPSSVCTFRELKLTDEFLDAESRTKAYLDDQERRGRTAQRFGDGRRKKKEKLEIKKSDNLDILKKVGERLHREGRLSQSNVQLFNKIINSRKERKRIGEHRKELEVLQEEHAKKNFGLPDIKAHLNAEIEYQIKLNPEYRRPRAHVTALQEKYWRVLQKRRQMYEMKKEFNTQVKNLREVKFQLLRDFQIAKRDIDYLSQEVSVDDIVFPRTPNFNTELEFPEKLFLNSPPRCILDDPIPPIPKQWQQERKDLFGSEDNIQEIVKEAEMVNKYVTYTWLPGETTHDDINCILEIFPVHPWRADMIQYRHRKFLEKLNSTAIRLVERIHEYDEEIKRLATERVQYEKNILLTKLDLYFLLQELEITRGFAILESGIRSKKGEMIKRKHIEILRMNIRKKKMRDNIATIEKSNVIANQISNQFAEVVKDNKYSKHLTRVFKKKYKPPRKKVYMHGEETSSSSSCDEDFDDEVEGDDLQVTIGGAYLFDEKIRPDDCDPDIFQKTFKFRAERHIEEAKISEAKTANQKYVKEIEVYRKTLLLVEVILAIFNLQLDGFLKCKQDAFNKVWRVVVLKPSQIQHYNKVTKQFPPLNQCIIINAATIEKLIRRAQNIEAETEVHNEARSKCKDHGIRLTRDIEFMEKQCHELKNEQKKMMMQKFGMEVDMENLESTITKWIIQDAELNAITMHRSMASKMLQGKAALKQKHRMLMEAKKEETNEYHELFSIQEERQKITTQILNLKQKQISRKGAKLLDLESILKSLEKEAVCQMAYKNYLLDQISLLKFKQKPRILDLKEKKVKKKIEVMSESTESAVRNVVFEIIKRALPSDSEAVSDMSKTSVQDEEEISDESEISLPVSQTKFDIPERPSQIAAEIIQEAIRGVIPSEPLIEEFEGFEPSEIIASSTESFHVPSPPPQSRISLPIGEETEEAMSEETYVREENASTPSSESNPPEPFESELPSSEPDTNLQTEIQELEETETENTDPFQLEITETEPEITETEPEITETEPEITETEPEITETEPEITEPEEEPFQAQIQTPIETEPETTEPVEETETE